MPEEAPEAKAVGHGSTIHREEVMPLVLQACPSFAGRWREYISSDIYQPELLYAHLGQLAHHLCALLRICDDSEFSAVFSLIERLCTEGDDYVKEAATIGLLEDIQNAAVASAAASWSMCLLRRALPCTSW